MELLDHIPKDLANIVYEYLNNKKYNSVINELNTKIFRSVDRMYDPDYNKIFWGSCCTDDIVDYSDYLNYIFYGNYGNYMPKLFYRLLLK